MAMFLGGGWDLETLWLFGNGSVDFKLGNRPDVAELDPTCDDWIQQKSGLARKSAQTVCSLDLAFKKYSESSNPDISGSEFLNHSQFQQPLCKSRLTFKDLLPLRNNHKLVKVELLSLLLAHASNAFRLCRKYRVLGIAVLHPCDSWGAKQPHNS